MPCSFFYGMGVRTARRRFISAARWRSNAYGLRAFARFYYAVIHFCTVKVAILKDVRAGLLGAAIALARPGKARRCGGCAQMPRSDGDP